MTKPNRVMLFREIIAVFCENHMEHANTLCGQNTDGFLMLKLVVNVIPLCFRGLKLISILFIANCASGFTMQVACYTYDGAVRETHVIQSCLILF
jgi:hypothetical protein